MASFHVTHQDNTTKARTGTIRTGHGLIHTPNFFPVGTQASIKGLSPEEVKKTGTEGILVNTYHTYLRPGHERIGGFGGLHPYMHWDKPIMTDSGGFQVFSLGFGIEHEVGKIVSLYGEDLVKGEMETGDQKQMIIRTKLCKIADEGPTFISHIDGSVHFFPPEKSIDVQRLLGADLIVALDECTSPLHDYTYTKTAMDRTHRWEIRSQEHFQKHLPRNMKRKTGIPIPDQGLYGVIQGGPYQDLREESAQFVSDHDFFGIGIGGALVSKNKMHEILQWIHPYMDPGKPRHLFGIGTIDDIFEAVERGVDTFDCVTPTRLGRMGYVLVRVESAFGKPQGRRKSKVTRFHTDEQLKAYRPAHFTLDVTKSVFLTSQNPIDPMCSCYTCQNFTVGYLCHLFRSRELLAYRLATIHNLVFMARLMNDIRQSIAENRFLQLKRLWTVV